MSETNAILVVSALMALIAGLVSFSTPNAGDQAEEFSGVWWISFEHSTFAEGAAVTSVPTFESAPYRGLGETFENTSYGWLNDENVAELPKPCGEVTVPRYHPDFLAKYEITFSGRRKLGASGHMDQYPAEYIVDRIIAIELVDEDCLIKPLSAATRP